MNLLRRTFGAVALAAPVLLTVTTPAVAHPLPHVDALVIQGSGTISPGIGVEPDEQSISFTGTATVVGTDGVLTTETCSFSGTDPAATIPLGSGTVSGSCGPISLSLCVFIRIGVIVQVVCAEVQVGVHVGTATATCVFRPHDSLPTTSFDLVCVAEVALV